MWKFQGEVACGAEEEERRRFSLPGVTGKEQASVRKGKPSCPLAGTPGGHSLSGPRSPLLEPCQPQHLSAWAQHGGGFWCQLEHVPAQLSGGERTGGQQGAFSAFSPSISGPWHLPSFIGLCPCV